jgi:endonuclease YncB( thermonuclease family)
MVDTLRFNVARVEDADTLMVEGDDGHEVPVRLWGIDAPEGRQPYGEAATRVAEDIIGREPVEVDITGRDRYGRIVGRVRVGDTNLGEALVAAGYAWYDHRRAPGGHTLRQLEAQAREDERGLWAQDDPTPPWTQRRGPQKSPFEYALTGAKIVAGFASGVAGMILLLSGRPIVGILLLAITIGIFVMGE